VGQSLRGEEGRGRPEEGGEEGGGAMEGAGEVESGRKAINYKK
jgi:hypothetical protein